MALTPVTRDEHYLAKADGQDVPTPSPVPREEQYLAKLSGQDVIVPTPTKRREKFLYAASGGNIELPNEDKMLRIEKFMAKAGGRDVTTPTAVTREEKFWANVEAGGWKVTELTGTLPITFKADGTALINYRIYGTADGAGVQTKNLLSIEDMAGQSVDVTITKIDEMTGSIEAETTSGHTYRNIWWFPEFEEGQTYIFSCYVHEENNHARLTFRRKSNNNVVASAWFTSTGLKSIQITYTNESYPGGLYIALMLNDNTATAGEINVSEIMLRRSDTTPDFIPYGYELPLTIANGTENKTSDIFIGDSKLSSGDYVDYETQTISRGGISEPAPFPLPEISTYKGTNILDSTETLGQVTIQGKIKEV